MALNPPVPVPDSGMPLAFGPAPKGLVGTVATGFTAVEQGEGTLRRTVIDLTAVTSFVTTPDTAALADGMLMYTFPTGQIWLHRVYGDIALDIDDNANDEDQAEVGLGSVIATGAVATLGAGASTWEDLWGPHIMTGCDAIATPADAIQVVTETNLIIPAANAHTVFLNCADTWANGAGTKDVFIQRARFVLDWTLLPAEGV